MNGALEFLRSSGAGNIWLAMTAAGCAAWALWGVLSWRRGAPATGESTMAVTGKAGWWQHPLGGMLVLGLAVRALVAALSTGYAGDVATFAAWADDVFRLGPGGFYRPGVFADYPPGYMWVLWPLGALRSLTGLATFSPGGLLLLKFPALLADMGAVWLLYRMACREGRQRPLWFAALLLFLPLAMMDSAVWGQVDGLHALVLLGALVLLEDRKDPAAAALFALAVLLKPQSLLLAPLALAALGDRFFHMGASRAWKNALASLGAFLAVALVLVLPFAWGREPGWIFGLYGSTLGSYPYLTLNAPNLWGFLGMNWASLGGAGQTFSRISWGLVIPLMGGTLFLVLRSRRRGRWLLGAALTFLVFFVLGVKMHERYLYPAVLLGLGAWAFTGDRRVLWGSLAAGITGALNLAQVLVWRVLEDSSAVPADDLLFRFLGLVNLACLGLAAWTAWQLLGRNAPAAEAMPKGTAGGNKADRTVPVQSVKGRGPKEPVVPEAPVPLPGFRIRRHDLAFMAAITLPFAVLSLVNLGTFSMPGHPWRPSGAGDLTLLDLGSETPVDTVAFQWGLGTGSYRVDWSDDLEAWTAGPELQNDNRFVEIRWRYVTVEARARYVRITCLSGNQELDEIAFWQGGIRIPAVLVAGAGAAVDEQSTATLVSDWKNGMYFDEVYHARAAREYLSGRDSSENTHPPLGKLCIAASMTTLGWNTFAWRLPGALAGICMLPVMYLIALRLFRKTPVAVLATGLFALDFMRFTQTRIATIDSFGVFFIMLAFFFFLGFLQSDLRRERAGVIAAHLLASGLAIGLGIASKWIALYAGAGLAVLWAAKAASVLLPGAGKSEAPVLRSSGSALLLTGGISVVAFVLIPAGIYLASYLPMMELTGGGLRAVLDNQTGMFRYHADLKSTHPYSSHWYQWPFMTKPIFYYTGRDFLPPGVTSSIYAFGNPVNWWGGTVAWLWLLGNGVARGLQTFRARFLRGGMAGEGIAGTGSGMAPWGMAFVLAGGLAQYLPWALIPRDLVFIYHFFATVPFLTLALAGELWGMGEHLAAGKSGRSVWVVPGAALGLAFLLFLWFYPVLGGLTVPREWFAPLRAFSGGWPF